MDQDGAKGNFGALSQITYDAIRQRTNTYSRVRVNNDKPHDFQFLALYQENTGYEIDLDRKECKKVVLPTASFRPIAIPDNATFQGDITIGVVLDAALWTGEVADPRGGMIYWEGGVTEVGCIPLWEAVYDSNGKGNFFRANFFNTVIGIPNPNVFLVPSYCDNAEVVDQSSPHNNWF